MGFLVEYGLCIQMELGCLAIFSFFVFVLQDTTSHYLFPIYTDIYTYTCSPRFVCYMVFYYIYYMCVLYVQLVY